MIINHPGYHLWGGMDQLETNHIAEFIALAECGNSYVAAERLFVSQSSLLRHVQAIEDEFGMPLFERTRKGFILNEAGHTFMPYARQIANLRDHCFKALHHEDSEENTVRLCSHGKIIDLMIDFRKQYPDYHIEYCSENNPEKALLENELDIAFLTNLMPEYTGSFQRIRYSREEVMVLLYEDHPLAQAESITMETLQHEDIIMLTNDVSVDDRFYARIRNGTNLPNIVASVPTGGDVLRMVREKQGVALIHGRRDTAPDVDGLCVRPLEPAIEYEMNIYFRKDVPMRKAAEAFVNYARRWIIDHKDLNTSLLE